MLWVVPTYGKHTVTSLKYHANVQASIKICRIFLRCLFSCDTILFHRAAENSRNEKSILAGTGSYSFGSIIIIYLSMNRN